MSTSTKPNFSKYDLIPVSKMQSRCYQAQTQDGYLGPPGGLPGTVREVFVTTPHLRLHRPPVNTAVTCASKCGHLFSSLILPSRTCLGCEGACCSH